MILTVNLEPDLHALATSLCKAKDCTISTAVNRLLRRSFPGKADRGTRSSNRAKTRIRFAVSRGRQPVTPDTVRRSEAGHDVA